MQSPSPPTPDLPPTEHRYPDSTAGPWVLTLQWQVLDGLPECVGVTLTSDPPQRLTDTVLRGLNVSRWTAADRARMITPQAASSTSMRASKRARYERVAEIYRAALRGGGQPAQAVAEAEGLSRGGASALISRVREAGLLPPTSAGVALGDVDQDPNVQ